jgi:polar amino acid transport system substrate-binding protein
MSGTLWAQSTLVLSTGGWPPFITDEQRHDGFIGHLIRDIFAELGIRVEYQYIPWRRAYVEASVGRFDGTAVWMDAEERHADFLYSDPVLDETFVFFHRRDRNFDWETFDDLEGLTLGGVIGYSYGPGLDAAIESGIVQVEWVRDDEANLRKLLAGRIDAYPQEVSVGRYYQRKHLTEAEQTQLTHHEQPLLVNQSFLLMPRALPESEARIAQFNAQLRQFREDGRYHAYFRAFNRGDYEP